MRFEAFSFGCIRIDGITYNVNCAMTVKHIYKEGLPSDCGERFDHIAAKTVIWAGVSNHQRRPIIGRPVNAERKQTKFANVLDNF